MMSTANNPWPSADVGRRSARVTGELISGLEVPTPSPSRGHRYGRRAARTLAGMGLAIAADSHPDAWAAAAVSLQQPVATGRRIAVLSPAGGVGRSALVTAITAELRRFRSDVVARIDLADQASGQAGTEELLAVSPRDAWEAVRARRPETRTELLNLLAYRDTRLVDLYASSPEEPLRAEDVRLLLSEVSRHAAVTIVECPAGRTDPRTLSATADAHAVIVVGRQDRASVRAVIDHASWLQNELPRTPVLAVANQRDRVAAPWHGGLRRSIDDRALSWTAIGHSKALRRDPHPHTVLERGRRIEVMQAAAAALTLSRGLRPDEVEA